MSEEVVVHEFTKQIHSTHRTGTWFSGMENWNEKEAKKEDKVSCRYCRYFWGGVQIISANFIKCVMNLIGIKSIHSEEVDNES